MFVSPSEWKVDATVLEENCRTIESSRLALGSFVSWSAYTEFVASCHLADPHSGYDERRSALCYQVVVIWSTARPEVIVSDFRWSNGSENWSRSHGGRSIERHVC